MSFHFKYLIIMATIIFNLCNYVHHPRSSIYRRPDRYLTHSTPRCYSGLVRPCVQAISHFKLKHTIVSIVENSKSCKLFTMKHAFLNFHFIGILTNYYTHKPQLRFIYFMHSNTL